MISNFGCRPSLVLSLFHSSYCVVSEFVCKSVLPKPHVSECFGHCEHVSDITSTYTVHTMTTKDILDQNWMVTVLAESRKHPVGSVVSDGTCHAVSSV